MTNPVPTRAALRALAELCHPERSFARQYSSSRRTSLCSGPGLSSRPTSCRRGLLPAAIQARWKTTVVDSPEPQVFANDPTRYDAQNRTGPEPKSQGTEDPQANASGPVLPDITNYYTLFPKTIPYGPPRGTSSIPDSSTLTQGDHPPASFHINPRDLRKEFLQLQSIHHPDKFPAGSVAHQRAYALSTLLNNAYKTLSDPLLRAQYLLENLYDIDVMSEDNSAHPTDPDTLMIVMEAQEELEGATNEGGEEIVERLKGDNRGRIRETEKELAAAFEAGDPDRAKNQSVKLKYWRSLESGLQDWEPGKEVSLTH
ncbi:molecular chaperone [Lithohypha guttulata]|uniref:Molecular chaperone n=1 Tax=Lithohypha guttulata TaxID=1690604 RepID=A0ABR0KH78_9EURO|nr:molecular chaperone [Lithohypha guttulata]